MFQIHKKDLQNVLFSTQFQKILVCICLTLKIKIKQKEKTYFNLNVCIVCIMFLISEEKISSHNLNFVPIVRNGDLIYLLNLIRSYKKL